MVSDFVTGYIGGLAGVVVGHPFDTVKVYIQTKKCELGAIGTLKNILRQEGAQGLFKGMTSPLYGTAFLCSILFGVNGLCTKTMPEHVRNTVHGQFVAGSAAGFSQSLVTCPLELVKIRMQLHDISRSSDAPRKKLTLTQQTLHILKEKAGYKTLFRGMTITLIRDIPGFGVYFATNQYIINRYKQSTIAGGCAGVASWVPSYPLDVVKTRIQSNPEPSVDTRFVVYLRHLIKSEGAGVLTRGLLTQLLRAFPVNAFTFGAASIAASTLGLSSPFLLQ